MKPEDAEHIKKITQEMLEKTVTESIISTEKTLQELSDDEVRLLLAYEMWKDGMEWPDVDKEIICDKWNKPPEWTRERMIEYLETIFDY